MALKYVWSGATGLGTGGSWANAFTTLFAAMTGVSTGDTIYVAHDHSESQTVARTYLFSGSGIGPGLMIVCVDRTSGAPATTGNINSTSTITMQGTAHIYGLIFTSTLISCNNAGTVAGSGYVFDQCTFVDATSGSGGGAYMFIGSDSAANGRFLLINPIFKYNGINRQPRFLNCNAEIIGGSLTSVSGGTFATAFASMSAYAGTVSFYGTDLTGITFTNLCGTSSNGAPLNFVFNCCKMPSSYTAYSQVGGDGFVMLVNCSNGSTNGFFGYYTGLGSMTSDTGVYFTSGAAALAWKIVTSSAATQQNPFISPWIDFYNTITSSVTPYIEVLRDGSTTAYTDAQLWGEFEAQATPSSILASFYRDRQAMVDMAARSAGTAQANGAGTGSWTGKSGTAWSGKVDSAAALTPNQSGYLRGRVCVGVASSTVYVDPQVRT